MKAQFKRPCNERGCKQLATETYCTYHKQQRTAELETKRAEERQVKEPWRWIYSTQAWHRAKRAAKVRDGWCCKATGCTETERLTVHHLIPLSQGGAPFDLDNLITLCYKHHAELERSKAQSL